MGPFSTAAPNVRGINSSKKQYQIFRFLEKQSCDIDTLQETKLSENDALLSVTHGWRDSHDIFHYPAIDYFAGCVILFRKDLQYQMCSVLEGADTVRLLAANVLIQNLPWRMVNLYAYNSVI